jgi:MFS superfamily sulfate permease-like transporter
MKCSYAAWMPKECRKVGWSFAAARPGILPTNTNKLASDMLAGVTLAALGISEVMSYTKISGTPIVTGLYTLLLPGGDCIGA